MEGPMHKTSKVHVPILILLAGSHLNASSQSLQPVARANLCVTEGTIEALPGAQLSVNVAKMRAYVNAFTPPVAQARFTYLGSPPSEAPLASGEMRRQFGLKLRAQNACNLVYAMWRFDPEDKVVVSVKSNPGQHTSAECSNHGYQNIKPRRSSPVPALRPGDPHTLRAEMSGAELRVYADNSVVWEGSLPPEALSFDGPVGMRSDNVRLQVEFDGAQPVSQKSSPGCRAPESE
jgi:hypothetical protein